MSRVVPMGLRGVRAWRWLACIAFATISVATHWPRLSFGPEGPSDKWIHAIAFAALSWCAWRAKWFASLVSLGVVMCAYAALDESTQQLEIFSRHTSLADYAADVLGIVVACALLWPAPSVQDGVERKRAALIERAQARVWDRPMTWLALATTGIVAILVGATLSLGYWQWWARDARVGQVVFLGTVTLVVASGRALLVSVGAESARRLRRDRACLYCGSPSTDAGAVTEDVGICSECGSAWHLQQWASTGSCSARDQASGSAEGGFRLRWWSVVIPLVALGIAREVIAAVAPGVGDLTLLALLTAVVVVGVVIRRGWRSRA